MAAHINDEMLKELADALRGVKDPRVQNAFVCLTGVSVTPDLKYAKVYYSSLRGEPKEVAKGLASSAGYLRREIAHRMNLRITPELTFVFDKYEVAPGYMGIVEFSVPTDALSDIVKDGYLQ